MMSAPGLADSIMRDQNYQAPACIRDLGSASAISHVPTQDNTSGHIYYVTMNRSRFPVDVMRSGRALSLFQASQAASVHKKRVKINHRWYKTWRSYPDDAEGGTSASSTLTELGLHIFEPSQAVYAEHAQKIKAAKEVYQEYSARIEALKSDAALDGFSLNEASERDFWSFIKSTPFIKEGGLVLMDNGNLRASWKDDEGNHIGLQFLGNRAIQYVIFRHRAGGHISRVAGCDIQKGVARQIKSFDLKSQMYA